MKAEEEALSLKSREQNAVRNGRKLKVN